MSTQKLPSVFAFLAGYAANKSHSQRHAHGCRPEVVRRQPHHLGEIAHGGLRRVGLPVGIGREGRRRVEGQVRSNGGEMLRIPGKIVLQPLNTVGQQQGDGAEHQHGEAIFRPAHLLFVVHARHAIKHALERRKERVRESALTLQIHEPCRCRAALRSTAQGQRRFRSATSRWESSELLRMEKRVYQVNQQKQRDCNQQSCAECHGSISVVRRNTCRQPQLQKTQRWPG